MHEINEKNSQTKIVIRKDQVKNTQKCTYLSFVRVVAGRKKNGNKEQSSRFTVAPKHLLSFIAKKPTTIQKKKKNHISFASYFPHLPQFSEQPNRS